MTKLVEILCSECFQSNVSFWYEVEKDLWELTIMHQPECGNWYSPKTTERAALDINHIIEIWGVILLFPSAYTSIQKF
jgi:hypothetical protein